jgi:hypothetical protein
MGKFFLFIMVIVDKASTYSNAELSKSVAADHQYEHKRFASSSTVVR